MATFPELCPLSPPPPPPPPPLELHLCVDARHHLDDCRLLAAGRGQLTAVSAAAHSSSCGRGTIGQLAKLDRRHDDGGGAVNQNSNIRYCCAVLL